MHNIDEILSNQKEASSQFAEMIGSNRFAYNAKPSGLKNKYVGERIEQNNNTETRVTESPECSLGRSSLVGKVTPLSMYRSTLCSSPVNLKKYMGVDMEVSEDPFLCDFFITRLPESAPSYITKLLPPSISEKRNLNKIIDNDLDHCVHSSYDNDLPERTIRSKISSSTYSNPITFSFGPTDLDEDSLFECNELEDKIECHLSEQKNTRNGNDEPAENGWAFHVSCDRPPVNVWNRHKYLSLNVLPKKYISTSSSSDDQSISMNKPSVLELQPGRNVQFNRVFDKWRKTQFTCIFNHEISKQCIFIGDQCADQMTCYVQCPALPAYNVDVEVIYCETLKETIKSIRFASFGKFTRVVFALGFHELTSELDINVLIRRIGILMKILNRYRLLKQRLAFAFVEYFHQTCFKCSSAELSQINDYLEFICKNNGFPFIRDDQCGLIDRFLTPEQYIGMKITEYFLDNEVQDQCSTTD